MVSLQDLPDEIILKVINYLKTKDLIRCGHISKRIRNISRDESLWQKINISKLIGIFSKPNLKYQKHNLPIEFLKMVLENGCQYLRLENTVLGSPEELGNVTKDKMCLKKVSKLRCLDLKSCMASKYCFEEILTSCYSLQKLSIISGFLKILFSQKMTESICYQNSRTLKTLNLRSCKGLDLDSIQKIANNCKNLTNVNFSGTCLSEESIQFLANNLTSMVEKLDLGYLYDVKDDHVKILVKRCDKLKLLFLRHTAITTLTHIIENLEKTLEKLDVSCCFSLTYAMLINLKAMPKLKVLNCSYCYSSDQELLKKKMPTLSFNEISVDEEEFSYY